MSFFTTAVSTMSTLVVALGGGVGVWGVVNLMEGYGADNQRAYLRKMAVDGYVVRVDMTDVKELAALLRTCSNNLNQIARRVNSTGNLYEEDIADLKTRYGELWGAFSSLLSKFEDL